MIDTVNLLPPGFGPRADPLLFGVSEGTTTLSATTILNREQLTASIPVTVTPQ